MSIFEHSENIQKYRFHKLMGMFLEWPLHHSDSGHMSVFKHVLGMVLSYVAVTSHNAPGIELRSATTRIKQ